MRQFFAFHIFFLCPAKYVYVLSKRNLFFLCFILLLQLLLMLLLLFCWCVYLSRCYLVWLLLSIFFGTFAWLTTLLIAAAKNVVILVHDSGSFSIAQPWVLLRAVTARFHVASVGDVRCLCFEWQRTFVR